MLGAAMDHKYGLQGNTNMKPELKKTKRRSIIWTLTKKHSTDMKNQTSIAFILTLHIYWLFLGTRSI